MRFILSTALLALVALSAYAQAPAKPSEMEAPASLQLKGYNSRDIETFVKAYSDTVKVYNSPGQLSYKGKDELRKRYSSMFAQTPDLHCELVNRIVSGNVVIDHERVQFSKDRPRKEAIAVYRIKNGEIYEVTFISPDKN
ncbi:nuclear transport factor 2 family protein [Pontibacter rugosus]|uniref:Nuclear transport factor 2 family protein n=1 Tax=Pontibacter rugosus TaxID=1745966 RepID=A0ABW3STM7_9BACT